jgi:hypothetical protein
MDLLVRGQHVITDPATGAAGVRGDGAVLVSGSGVAVGEWKSLRRRHARARVVGSGKQLLMPGLVDAHSHGRALSPIQKGVLDDCLENNLLDWGAMPGFDPELTAALGRVAPPPQRLHDHPPYREIRKAARHLPRQRRPAEMLQRLKPHYQAWYNAWLPPQKAQPYYVLNSRA